VFEKVLIPTDFSDYSKKVIECIGDVPGVKEVVLLNVLTRPTVDEFWDPMAEIKAAEDLLMKLKTSIKAPGINVRVKAEFMMEGEVSGVIQRVAEDEQVSLVAMGARGKSRIKSVLLGSVSRNMLRFGDAHLLIMRYKTVKSGDMEKYCERVFARVLFPTDFSQPAEMVLSFLKGFGKIGELVLLNVISKGETEGEIEANVASATMMLDDIAQELSKGGIKVTPKVVVGHPVEAIRSEAENEDASLIAIISQGSMATGKGRIGSTVYDVANSASRPVLILRKPKILHH
jgi:nucleotide-binding universal stress UspA family protein